MTDLELHAPIDEAAILRSLNLNPADVNTQALLLICRRYDLDPIMKQVVLISGRPYVTRDGYLHIAHASGQFDGMEVVDESATDTEWRAKVSVYRKDMSHPFTYTGRYPLNGQQKKYGPEMAVKTAEVMALRRAFDVTGVAAADEQLDDVEPTPVHVTQTPPELPEGWVTVADAKRQVLDACDGDKDRAAGWWADIFGIDRHDPLEENEVDELVESIKAEVIDAEVES